MDEQLNVAEQVYSGLATIVWIFGLGIIAVGLLLLARIIFLFFGSLKSMPGYEQIVNLSDIVMGPMKGVQPVVNSYDGVLDVAAAVVLLALLVLEFVRRGVENWLERQAARVAYSPPQPQTEISLSNLPEEENSFTKK